jgi:hypothetical protein
MGVSVDSEVRMSKVQQDIANVGIGRLVGVQMKTMLATTSKEP